MGGYQAVLAGVEQPSGLALTLADGQASAVLNSISEGVCLAQTDGEILWANERFRCFDESTRHRIMSVCRRAAQHFEEQRLAQDAAGYSLRAKYDVVTPDESKCYEVVVSPVFGSEDPTAEERTEGIAAGSGNGLGGKIERVAAIIWDVSSARRMQHKMDAIDRAGAELCRLDAGSVRKLHVGERLKILEEKIVRFSHELLNFDHLSIRLIDEKTGRLELVISCGMTPEATEVEMYAQRDANGIMGYVAATGRPYLCPDTAADRRYVVGMSGAKSSLTVPLRLHDKVIGSFNVESERLAAFSEEDRQFAEIFATHVAMALHILDLLVAERCVTGENVTGTVQGELSEPLADIAREVESLRRAVGEDANLKRHVDRIMKDVDSIRQRVRDAASGPQTILGAEKALLNLTEDPELKGKHILIADDEPKIRQIIRDVLRGKGCRVVVCSDGAGAIEELDRAAGCCDERCFDMVLSDIKMPDRNGYEVFAAARRTAPEIPVILMTGFGYDPHHSIVRASQEGLQCVLFKPFQVERLLDEIKKALNRVNV